MFGFGWVRTHPGVVFIDAIFGFLMEFLKNGQNQQNLGKFWGPTPRHRDLYVAV